MRTVSRTDYLTAVAHLAAYAGAEPEKVAGIECFRGYYSARFRDTSGGWTTSIVHVIDTDDGRCICPSANDPEDTGPDEDCPHHGRDATETFAENGPETGFKPGSLADQMLRDPDGYWNRVMEKARSDAGESSRSTARNWSKWYTEQAILALVAAEHGPERRMVEVAEIKQLSEVDGLIDASIRVEGKHANGHLVWAFFPGTMNDFVARLLGQHDDSKE